MARSFIRWHVVESADKVSLLNQASYASVKDRKFTVNTFEDKAKAWKALFKQCIEPGDVIIENGRAFLYSTQYNRDRN